MQKQTTVSIQPFEISDGVLAQQALSGNQQAFEILVRRYSTSLLSFSYHILGDYDQACDILQQVFIQLHISLSNIRTDEPIKPWLFQVARNRCLDHIRQRQRRQTIHFSDLETTNDENELPPLVNIPDNSPLPEEIVEHKDLQQRLQLAIQALPPRFRAVVFLRYAGQLSFSEIAQTLSMPTATAKTYFQRAKPLLRANLHDIAPSITHSH